MWFPARAFRHRSHATTTRAATALLLVLSATAIATALSGAAPGPQDAKAEGRVLFHRVWTAADGLGPTFNAPSCAACHADDADSAVALRETPIVWVTAALTDPTGGHLFQRFSLNPDGAPRPLQVPSGAARRRAPPLFGLGLLEAWKRPSAGAGAGRALVPDGRFGWKARYATLEGVVAGALAGEMGLTTAQFPNRGTAHGGQTPVDVSLGQVAALTAFVRSLSPPSPRPSTTRERKGRQVFEAIKCTQCHVLGKLMAPGSASNRAAEPFTDLLLHDMGPELSDGITEGTASPTHFRTPALWGLGRLPAGYLHDGRAASLHDAISAHDGESRDVTARYLALHSEDRAALLAFLKSL